MSEKVKLRKSSIDIYIDSIKAELNLHTEQKSTQYNFDFIKETPLKELRYRLSDNLTNY